VKTGAQACESIFYHSCHGIINVQTKCSSMKVDPAAACDKNLTCTVAQRPLAPMVIESNCCCRPLFGCHWMHCNRLPGYLHFAEAAGYAAVHQETRGKQVRSIWRMHLAIIRVQRCSCGGGDCIVHAPAFRTCGQASVQGHPASTDVHDMSHCLALTCLQCKMCWNSHSALVRWLSGILVIGDVFPAAPSDGALQPHTIRRPPPRRCRCLLQELLILPC